MRYDGDPVVALVSCGKDRTGRNRDEGVLDCWLALRSSLVSLLWCVPVGRLQHSYLSFPYSAFLLSFPSPPKLTDGRPQVRLHPHNNLLAAQQPSRHLLRRSSHLRLPLAHLRA